MFVVVIAVPMVGDAKLDIGTLRFIGGTARPSPGLGDITIVGVTRPTWEGTVGWSAGVGRPAKLVVDEYCAGTVATTA
jgi:hypothetical protein